MTRSARWIRLNTNYADSAWLAELSGDARRLWPDLLCYVKAQGVAGRCRAFTPKALAKKLDTSEANASEMLAAAFADGALEVTEDGDWAVTGWHDYQDPTGLNAERQRRFREKNKKPSLKVSDGKATSA